ncbi:MAG: peptidoglycan-binding domain-containing protein, partial [Candidatus Paceibacterota bacterium]
MNYFYKIILSSGCLSLLLLLTFSTAAAQQNFSQQLEAIKQQVYALQEQVLHRSSTSVNFVKPSVSTKFDTNLTLGDSSSEVRQLQVLLNQVLYQPVAASGPGSVGQETAYFGAKTLAAVKRFQDRYAVDILAPTGLLAPTGFVGPSTRAKLNQLVKNTTTGSSRGENNVSTVSNDVFSNDDELAELRSRLVFDKWELTEADKQKIVQSVPAELRSRYFPDYAGSIRDSSRETDAPQNILEREYQRLLEQQSSLIESIRTLAFLDALTQPSVLLENSLATIFGRAETADAQAFSVFGGRISLTTPCTCNPPAVLVTVVGVRPAAVVYFPGVTQKSPPTPP